MGSDRESFGVKMTLGNMTHAAPPVTSAVIADPGTGSIVGGVYQIATTGAVSTGQWVTVVCAAMGSGINSISDPTSGAWSAIGNVNSIGPNAWTTQMFSKRFTAPLAPGSILSITVAINTIKAAIVGVAVAGTTQDATNVTAKTSNATQTLTTSTISAAGTFVATEFNAQQVPTLTTGTWTLAASTRDAPNLMGLFMYTRAVLTPIAVTLGTTTSGATDFAFLYSSYI